MKPKWFYEGYVVYRDKERVFHKVPVCVPIDEWSEVYGGFLKQGYKMLEINVRRERNV